METKCYIMEKDDSVIFMKKDVSQKVAKVSHISKITGHITGKLGYDAITAEGPGCKFSGQK